MESWIEVPGELGQGIEIQQGEERDLPWRQFESGLHAGVRQRYSRQTTKLVVGHQTTDTMLDSPL
jgi:hypothetical protein